MQIQLFLRYFKKEVTVAAMYFKFKILYLENLNTFNHHFCKSNSLDIDTPENDRITSEIYTGSSKFIRQFTNLINHKTPFLKWNT